MLLKLNKIFFLRGGMMHKRRITRVTTEWAIISTTEIQECGWALELRPIRLGGNNNNWVAREGSCLEKK